MNLNELVGHKVLVYWNVRRKQWSVRSRMPGPTYGHVVAHLDLIILREARAHVGEAGRQRVLATRQKEIHAWISGTVGTIADCCWVGREIDRIAYNPYKNESFLQADRPVRSFAHAVVFDRNTVYTLAD